MKQLTIDTIEESRIALDEQGYAVLPGLVSKPVLSEFRAAIDEEYERANRDGHLFEGGGSFSGHLNCSPGKLARAPYEEIRASGVFDLVRSLRPDWADQPRVTLNYNLPGSVAQHYHMDGVYTRDFLICNVAVVDTDLVNGAIDVLPGTNREFLPFWKYALTRAYRGTTRLPLEQGDVVLRRSTLWHRGMPNKSARPRQMLAVTFGEVPETDPDLFGEDRGGDTEFYPNWFRPTRLGRIRERVFVAAPVTYSAYRFARSLSGHKGYDR